MISKTIQLGSNASCTLECMIHEPDRSGRKRPAVIVCPGGAYAFHTPNEGSPVAAAFFSRGFNAFVLYYSVGFRAMWPQTQVEASQAIMLVREKSEEWGIDPNAIAIGGFSAGGSMGANAATYWNDPKVQEICGAKDRENRPNAVFLIYPAANIMMATVMNGELESININPASRVNKDTPPAFIAHSFMDNVVSMDQSLLLAQAYSQHDVPMELHIFTPGEHGAISRDSNTPTKYGERVCTLFDWFDRCCEWMQERFYHSVPDGQEEELIVTPFGDNRRKKGTYLANTQIGKSRFGPQESEAIDAQSSLGRFCDNEKAMQLIYEAMPQLKQIKLNELAKEESLGKWLYYCGYESNDPRCQTLFQALRDII